MNKKKLFTAVSIGIFAVGIGGVLNLSSATSLDSLKSAANRNQLTADSWDKLVDEVKKLSQEKTSLVNTTTQNLTTLTDEIKNLKQKNQSQDTAITQVKNSVSSVENSAIPAGAVMAFDLTACPNGWQAYQAASERFIMGSAISNNKATQLGQRGGNKEIMMRVDQLAPHSHLFEDTAFVEEVGSRFKPGETKGHYRADWNMPGNLLGSKGGHDGDNRVFTFQRRTSTAVSNKNGGPRSGAITWDTPEDKPVPQKPLEILNPYIKLLYCKKL